MKKDLEHTYLIAALLREHRIMRETEEPGHGLDMPDWIEQRAEAAIKDALGYDDLTADDIERMAESLPVGK